MPLMVRWPGRIEAGSTSNAMVGPIDLYPTILEAIGLRQPADHAVDGLSFLPVLLRAGTFDGDRADPFGQQVTHDGNAALVAGFGQRGLGGIAGRQRIG